MHDHDTTPHLGLHNGSTMSADVAEPTFGRPNDFQPDNPRHVPAALAAAYLAYVAMPFGGEAREVVTVDLIRSWAHRGYVRRVGTHPVTRHALYDLEDIVRRAHDRGLLASESTAV